MDNKKKKTKSSLNKISFKVGDSIDTGSHCGTGCIQVQAEVLPGGQEVLNDELGQAVPGIGGNPDPQIHSKLTA